MAHGHTTVSEKLNSEKGFTLIEILLAMLCFTIVALALNTTSTHAWNDTAFVRSAGEVGVMASRVIEELRLLKYQDDALTEGAHPLTIDGHQITYTITNDAIVPDTKSVAVQVAYSRKGVTKTLRFHHLLAMITH